MVHHPVLLATTNKMTIMANAVLRRSWLWPLFALVLLALPLSTLAQGFDPPRPAPVVLTDAQEKYPLGRHLELLADPTGQLTIDDVSSPAYDDQFIPSQADMPNIGYTTGAIWVRLRLRNQADPATAWRLAVAEPRLGYVDLYTPAPDGTGFTRQQAGRFRPFTVRDVPYRYGLFNLHPPPDQAQTIYLRVQSASPLQLPLTLWSLEAFSDQAQTELLELGLFYGALLVMLGYNMFLFAALRNPSYLYLVLFIAAFGLTSAFHEGLIQQYLWPAWPNLYGIEISGTFSLISLLLFGADFLQTKIRTPRLHQAIVAIILLTAVALGLRFFWETNTVLNAVVLGGTVIVIAAGYVVWRQGYRPARYFLLAWLPFLGFLVINGLVNAGFLAGISLFVWYNLQVGTVLMVMLLSLALADRINLLQVETVRVNLALSESEQRLTRFLEAMPVGITVYDASARLTYINRHARHLLNLSPDPTAPNGSALTLDQAVERVSPSVANTRQPYPLDQLPVARALQGEAVAVDDLEIEANGSKRRIQLEVWANPIFDPQEQLQYAIAVFRDITKRKLLEAELRHHRQRLEDMVAERTRQLSAFLDVTILVSEARTLPEVADVALGRIMEFCHCQALALHLLDEERGTLNLLTQRGLTVAQQEQLQTIPLTPALADWLSQRQEPLLALEPDHAAHLPPPLRLAGFQVYMGAQLRAKARNLGVLSHYRRAEQAFSMDEISPLVALTELLGIVIENLRLRAHIEEIAVVAERQRLARDLHDSITQSLYSINLFTQAARESSEDNDPERLAGSLNRIEAIALAALKEMRLLLYQLQPDVLTEKGLALALQQRFDSVERRLDIEVDYQVVGHFELPPDIAEALYRAALEILNNSLKHAGANHLMVRLTMAEPLVELEITDNGCGFEVERVSGGMGLQNIRQRLEQQNGFLLLSSTVGTGTKVKLAVSVDGESAQPSKGVLPKLYHSNGG